MRLLFGLIFFTLNGCIAAGQVPDLTNLESQLMTTGFTVNFETRYATAPDDFVRGTLTLHPDGRMEASATSETSGIAATPGFVTDGRSMRGGRGGGGELSTAEYDGLEQPELALRDVVIRFVRRGASAVVLRQLSAIPPGYHLDDDQNPILLGDHFETAPILSYEVREEENARVLTVTFEPGWALADVAEYTFDGEGRLVQRMGRITSPEGGVRESLELYQWGP